eukprot:750889-Hanusia_phi.AAC.3
MGVYYLPLLPEPRVMGHYPIYCYNSFIRHNRPLILPLVSPFLHLKSAALAGRTVRLAIMNNDSISSCLMPDTSVLKAKKRPSLLEFLQDQVVDSAYPNVDLCDLSLQDGETFVSSPLVVSSPQSKHGYERSSSFGCSSSKKLQSPMSDCSDCEYIETHLNAQASRKQYNSFIGRSASM